MFTPLLLGISKRNSLWMDTVRSRQDSQQGSRQGCNKGGKSALTLLGRYLCAMHKPFNHSYGSAPSFSKIWNKLIKFNGKDPCCIWILSLHFNPLLTSLRGNLTKWLKTRALPWEKTTCKPWIYHPLVQWSLSSLWGWNTLATIMKWQCPH